MRTKDILINGIDSISILISYLYMDEDNYIEIPPFNNRLRIDEQLEFRTLVVGTGIELYSSDTWTINSLYALVENLKTREYDVQKHKISNPNWKSEWDYIRDITNMHIGLNKYKSEL